MKAVQTEQSESDYLTPAAAARATGLSVRQLARFAEAGKIRSIRPGTHRRYLRADVEALGS